MQKSSPIAARTQPMAQPAREIELVAAATRGERAAFDELVRLHFSAVYALLHRLTGNHEDAEDLAQECFVRAWRHLASFRGEAPLGSWLSRIALSLARDHYRARGTRGELGGMRRPLAWDDAGEPNAPNAKGEGPTESLARGETERLLRSALARLPLRLREALVLRAVEGREYDEVAAITGVRPATARTQVMQARRLLLRWLAPLLEDDRKRPREERRR